MTSGSQKYHNYKSNTLHVDFTHTSDLNTATAHLTSEKTRKLKRNNEKMTFLYFCLLQIILQNSKINYPLIHFFHIYLSCH